MLKKYKPKPEFEKGHLKGMSFENIVNTIFYESHRPEYKGYNPEYQRAYPVMVKRYLKYYSALYISKESTIELLDKMGYELNEQNLYPLRVKKQYYIQGLT